MSISGQRETANGFAINGSNGEEGFNMGSAIVPNLDSIQEFRVLTGNFEAQYGNYSGGQVLVVTERKPDHSRSSKREAPEYPGGAGPERDPRPSAAFGFMLPLDGDSRCDDSPAAQRIVRSQVARCGFFT